MIRLKNTIKSTLLFSVLAGLCLCYPAQSETLKLDLNTVNAKQFPEVTLQARPSDKMGRSVPGLEKSFQLEEDQQKLSGLQVKSAKSLLLSTAVVLDLSSGLSPQLSEMRQRAKRFLELMYPQDKSLLVRISSREEVLQDLGEPSKVLKKLADTKSESGSMAPKKFQDGLMLALNELAKSPPSERVMLVLSDGRDLGSSNTLDDVISKAKGYHVRIHTLLYGQLDSREMKRLALTTGGRHLFAPTTSETEALYKVTVANLKGSYQLEFDSPRVDSAQSREVKVSLKDGISKSIKYIPPADRVRSSWLLAAIILGGLLLIGLGVFLLVKRKSPALADPTPTPSPVPPTPHPWPQPDPQPKPSPIPKDNHHKINPIVVGADVFGNNGHSQPKPNPNPKQDPVNEISSNDDERTIVLNRKKAATDLIHLIYRSGSQAGMILTLPLPTENAPVIGRKSSCDLVVSGESVSREHAKIRFKDKQLLLYDLASSGGTLVNGQKIVQQALRDGDQIHFGEVEMVFKWTQLPKSTKAKKESRR